MQSKLVFRTVILVALISATIPASAETVATQWGGDAVMVYNEGFMHMLMKHPEGGVCLFNMDLVENDSPGAGKPR